MRELQGLLIGAIVIVALATAGISMMAQVNTYNPTFLANVTNFDELNNTFSAISGSVNGTAEQLKSTFTTPQNEGKFGFIDTFLKAITTTAQTIGRSMSFFTTFFGQIDSFLPVPSWVGSLISTIILLIIGFAIWKLVFAVT